ncbi:barren [Hanseniaspora valbyensis NRRL Y-1626]|uniref:Condensin complex subunit 2 n=1 Tax=Hanseniaspora valbyensis NRRL Y-1626 TaxID=766949 RepID=A0A1B7TJW6_9ASCO|nr:barren [Hanseniaspora valbyensis NRRL Y-1626]
MGNINRKNSKSKSYKHLGFSSGENGTTIKKVMARDLSSSNKKRIFSNNKEIRKNLLDDAVDNESQSNGSIGLGPPIKKTITTTQTPSLFEGGNKAKILANFEEWIKLATDNKINVKNSWNFALIDYFHDLNVLKENNGNINFQKASATLDGCVKIYASRIDSVANETGKLLSGLVTSNENINNTNNRDGLNSQGSDELMQSGDIIIDEATGLPISTSGENGNLDSGGSSRRRVNNRILETTLTSFDNLKLSSFDQEYTIDPLFKKALADFDEAGAKNLLLSILHIQNDAKVVFDTTEEYETSSGETIVEDENADLEEKENVEEEDIEEDVDMEDTNINQSSNKSLLPPLNLEYKIDNESKEEESLKAMDEAILNLGISLGLDKIPKEKELCNSLKFVRECINDISKVKNLLDNVVQEGQPEVDNDIIDIKDTSVQLSEEIVYNNDNEDALHAMDISNVMDQELAENVFINDDRNDNDISGFGEVEQENEEEEEENFDLDFEKNLYSQFNNIFQSKYWTGKDHWKVKNIKKRVDPIEKVNDENSNDNGSTSNNQNNLAKTTTQKSKKKKQRQHIDFFSWSPVNEEMLIHSESPKINGVRRIDIPLKNRKDIYYNLLPTDYHVTLEKMTVLFTRPLQKGNFFRKKTPLPKKRSILQSGDNISRNEDNEVINEGQEEYWANIYEDQNSAENPNADDVGIENPQLTTENAFDDIQADIGLDFNDALGNDEGMGYEDENININKLNPENALTLNAGLLLSSSVELKEDEEEAMKKQTTIKAMLALNATQKVNYSRVAKKVDIKKLKDNLWRCIESQLMHIQEEEVKELKFTKLIQQLKTLYTFESIKDLSTSFCFICLLHLANEHGFVINKDENNLLELTLVF